MLLTYLISKNYRENKMFHKRFFGFENLALGLKDDRVQRYLEKHVTTSQF